MAVKISALPTSTNPPTTADLLPIVQSSTTKQTTLGALISQLLGFLPSGTGAVAESLQAMGRRWIWGDQYSGVDIGAQINAAIAALPAGGGTIYLPRGTYSFSTKIQLPITGGTSVILQGAGGGYDSVTGTAQGATVLKFTGSGVAIDQTFTAGASQNLPGAMLTGFVLDGIGASAGAIGVQFGGSVGFRSNISVQNFSGAGSVGIKADNGNGLFTERYVIEGFLGNNTKNLIMKKEAAGSASFGHGFINIWLDSYTTQVGISVEGGGSIYKSTVIVNGNLTVGGGTPTGIAVDATSSFISNTLLWHAESDGGTAVRFAVTAGGSFNAFGQFNGGFSDTGTVTMIGYDAVSGNYLVPSTVISFGGSLTLSGAAGQVLGSAGGVLATPAFSISGDGSTGFYGVSAGVFGFSNAGTDRIRFSDTIDIRGSGSTTISTGVGSVRMSTVNAATNTAWIPIRYAGTIYYVPGWTTNAP